MLVSATAMLRAAERGHYGIAAFNTNNLEWTRSILTAAEQTQSPVIVQCTSGAAKWQTSFKVVSEIVHTLTETMGITVPVALHLDHGTYEDCFTCIDAGFTSIMYDGSKEPDFETNLARTAELVKVAHAKGLSIEAEVGGIGGVEDGVASLGEVADPAQCLAIAQTGVDFLACGIGNIHGLYPANWAGLQFDVLAAIKEKVGDLPLVLHGGTGIPTDQVQKAISMGVAKINVNTDLQVAFAKATRAYIEAGLDQQGKGYDPRKLLKPGFEAIVARAEELIRTFGSDGKGWAA
ncbi:class II fructose-1,6-bisphosphate aldolase [bacterium]|nr:class II fructose-1,6-bisphosphate aldolase [bacterium]